MSGTEDKSSGPLTIDVPTLLEEAVAARHLATTNHYAAIGIVAAQWSYFEAIIDHWAHFLAALPPEAGVCFTAQIIGFRGKMDALISLAGYRSADAKGMTELHEIAEKAMRLSEKRNRVIHDVWFLDRPEAPERLEATAKRKLRFQVISVSTDSLLRLGDEIRSLAESLDEIASHRLLTLRRTSSEIPLPNDPA